MAMSDILLGRLMVIGSIALIGYYFTWVTLMPIMKVSNDSWLLALFPPTTYTLILPGLFGFCFIGSIVLSTLYNIIICK